jgi:hypothetical protein
MFFFKKPRIYLKTLFYSPHEIKFLKLNIREASPFVDKVIICEFNRTHIGTERSFIFEQYLDTFSKEEQEKILYLPCDISGKVAQAADSEKAHLNERLMRGYFVSQLDLNQRDIIISVDADEIIFRRNYPKLLNQIGVFQKAIKIQLYQFFYKINYLWEDENFIAPTIARVGYYKDQYPGQWRYDGKLYPEKVGCHFAWCMSIEDMIKKLQVYGHSFDYRHFANKEILENAVQTRTYPFDPQRKFLLKALDFEKNVEYFPETIFTMLDSFDGLIG